MKQDEIVKCYRIKNFESSNTCTNKFYFILFLFSLWKTNNQIALHFQISGLLEIGLFLFSFYTFNFSLVIFVRSCELQMKKHMHLVVDFE